jgi:hypothetical protein
MGERLAHTKDNLFSGLHVFSDLHSSFCFDIVTRSPEHLRKRTWLTVRSMNLRFSPNPYIAVLQAATATSCA